MSRQRPLPKITPGQLQNLQQVSRTQLQQANDRTERSDLESRFNAERAEIDRAWAASRQRWEANEALNRKYVPWIARACLVPVALVAMGMVVLVGLGLIDGEIKEIVRQSSKLVSRADQPLAYWASVLYHSALASFLCFIARQCLRGSLWGTRFERAKDKA